MARTSDLRLPENEKISSEEPKQKTIMAAPQAAYGDQAGRGLSLDAEGLSNARDLRYTIVISDGKALAMPKSGRRQYERYLRKELNLSNVDTDKLAGSTVEVEFDLNDEGTPFNVEAISHTGVTVLMELNRVLTEGPKWDVERAQVPKGRLLITFENK